MSDKLKNIHDKNTFISMMIMDEKPYLVKDR